jgi:hypothetical protein
MGLFKKIFKPVSRVLDKVIPNEIKPLLPYAAAFAPVFGPTAQMFGTGIMQRALLAGGANIFGQLAQEGNEGDVNLLSAGIGALTGAMTAPGFKSSLEGFRPESFNEMTQYGAKGTDLAKSSFLDKATNVGIDALQKGSDILIAGGKDPFSKAGLKAAIVPAATATGDLLAAEARRAAKDVADEALLGVGEGASDADRALAIRTAMLSYGYFTDDEIEDTITAAGYADGGRVGLEFGGITEAVETIEQKPKEFLVDKLKITQMPGQSEMRAIIEAMYNDIDGVMSEDRKKQFYELYAPQMYRNGDMDESEFNFIQTEILGKNIDEPKMAEGGLMDLGGKEMDLRGGGFVPIGKKEKADDVPARLSKNEFVMTADAVRAVLSLLLLQVLIHLNTHLQ